MKRRIDLGSLSLLGLGATRIVRPDASSGAASPLVSLGAKATPACASAARDAQSILVLRTPSGVRAFWNICQHLPIPLDGGLGTLPNGELVCQSHGARYEREQGLCMSGPGRGRWLEPVPVELDEAEDRIYALLDP